MTIGEAEREWFAELVVGRLYTTGAHHHQGEGSRRVNSGQPAIGVNRQRTVSLFLVAFTHNFHPVNKVTQLVQLTSLHSLYLIQLKPIIQFE